MTDRAMTDRAVRLDPMTDDEYESRIEQVIAGYAEDQAAAGIWSEDEAPRLAREQTLGLVPDGLATPGSHMYTVRDAATGDAVGVFWFLMRPHAGRTEAFIYQIATDERFRGLGYGRAAMRAGADRARALGAAAVRLSVHGRNAPARSLYRSLGYEEVRVEMVLDLAVLDL